MRDEEKIIKSLEDKIRRMKEAFEPIRKTITALSSVEDSHSLVVVYAQYAPQGGVGSITAGELRKAVKTLDQI